MMSTSVPLFIYPKMGRDESPGSVLLRLSGAHFERPSTYLGALTQKQYVLANLIREFAQGKARTLDDYIDRSAWQPPSLYLALHKQRKHHKWYNFKRAKVCPDCADEGKLPLYHDLRGVDACAKHGWRLIKVCSSCNDPLTWNRPHLQSCTCLAQLSTREAATAGEVQAARLIKRWLYTDDLERLETYNELRHILKKRFNLWPAAQTQALAFVQGDPMPLARSLEPFVLHPDYHSARAVAAPFITLPASSYKGALNTLISHLVACRPNSPSLPSDFYLTRRELAFTLSITRLVDSVAKGQLAEHRFSTQGRYGIRCGGVEMLLKALYVPHTQQQGTTIRRLITLHRLSAADWLDKILAGETRAVAPGETLLDIQLDEPDTVESSVPDGYMTLPQAAAYLEMYPEAVRKMMLSGLIEAELQLNHNRRYILAKATLDQFLATYITGGQLAAQLEVEPRRFSERLIAAGATPVAGPSVDKCNIFVFRRTEVDNPRLINRALALVSYSNSGRRPDSAPTIDTAIWAGATEAAAYLNTSVQQLTYLESVSPLTEAYPAFSRSGSGRYYRWESVRAAKTFLDTLVDIDHLAKRTRLARPKLLRRIGRLFKNPLIKLNNTTYISSADANKVELHCKRYWCADVAADYLDCRRHDINNWRRLGHLSALEQNHPGFIEGLHLYESRLIKQFQPPGAQRSPSTSESTTNARSALKPRRKAMN